MEIMCKSQLWDEMISPFRYIAMINNASVFKIASSSDTASLQVSKKRVVWSL